VSGVGASKQPPRPACQLLALCARLAALTGRTWRRNNQAAAWFTVNWEPAMRCAGDRRLGPNGDGGKWVCDPDCLLKKGQCVAFRCASRAETPSLWADGHRSIGSKNQFGFENSLAPFGCTVHTFDHTVTNPTPPAHVSFYKYGLDGPGGSDPQLKSLLELRDLTGVTKIDLLKVDCEGCEFEALGAPEVLEFLANNVRQILIEVHWARGQRDAVERLVLLAERLRAAGFLTFSKEPNILARAGENIEYSLVRLVCRACGASPRAHFFLAAQRAHAENIGARQLAGLSVGG